jgi:5-methyltetrahydrofolate--homocysteine methyltransferase
MADLESLKQMIIDGDESAPDHALKLVQGGLSARQVLDGALLPGMEEVGRRMKAGETFIPEVLLSAQTMQNCLDGIKPYLAEGDTGNLATIVIGTVEGDMHDIGKNLVAMLLSGAGFNVINLGKGISPAAFVKAVQEHKPAIIGMSGLLTTTVPKMPATIAALKEAGLRDSVKVIVGGAPVSEEYAKEIGADDYGPNASIAVDRCKALVGIHVAG